jgi:hypothetical protein
MWSEKKKEKKKCLKSPYLDNTFPGARQHTKKAEIQKNLFFPVHDTSTKPKLAHSTICSQILAQYSSSLLRMKIATHTYFTKLEKRFYKLIN